MPAINIQPPSGVYDTFGRLNYKPWYALAEFVDNATQNFFDHQDALRLSDGRAPVLHVDIDYRDDVVTVSDDAHGMGLEEFSRAVRLSAPPPDRSGRSEFGMGLKTAACWFGRRWTLTSTRLGEPVEYSVTMDLEALSRSESVSLDVRERAVPAASHGTTLRIEQLRNRIHGRTGEVVRKTLASMYRQDLAVGSVIITVNGQRLAYAYPELHTDVLPDGTTRTWRMPLEFSVVDPHTKDRHFVTGWIGIRATSSRKESGFAFIRRGRLVLGGYDAGWLPSDLFGQAGSATWIRLVGELYCDTFPVNFSKDGFAWDGGLEEALIHELRPLIAEYRSKASNLRTRQKAVGISDVSTATEGLERRYEESDLKRDLGRLEIPVRPATDPVFDSEARDEMVQRAEGPAELKVPLPGGYLLARMYTEKDRQGAEWMMPSFADPNEVDVVLNTAHPYVAANLGSEDAFRVLVHFALATALAEKRARYLAGGENVRADDLRTHLDAFLRHAVD